ncbi:ABC-2 family transporter protein [Shouchella clausii]
MLKYLRLYVTFLRFNFKALLSYRVDFIVGSFGFFVSTSALLLTLLVIFSLVDEIGGWSQNEIILLFAFTGLSRALWNFFMFNTLFIGTKIKDGSLDMLLLRPLNPFFLLITEKIDPDTIGEIVFHSVLLLVSLYLLDTLHLSTLFWVIILIISSTLCFAAVHLIVNTLTFWIIENSALSFIVWRMDELITYPLNIYPLWLQNLLTVIPFGFVGYYPVQFLIADQLETLSVVSLLSPIAGPVMFYLAYLFWKRGLQSYQSTGS